MKHYADVKAKPDFSAMEKEILQFWEEDKTIEKSVHNRDGEFCKNCKTIIIKTKINGRGTYYCPSCQKGE